MVPHSGWVSGPTRHRSTRPAQGRYGEQQPSRNAAGTASRRVFGFPVFVCDEPVGMLAVQPAGGGGLKRHQPDAGFHSGLADSPGDGFKRFRPAFIPVEPVAHEGLVAVVDLDHPRRITLPVELQRIQIFLKLLCGDCLILIIPGAVAGQVLRRFHGFDARFIRHGLRILHQQFPPVAAGQDQDFLRRLLRPDRRLAN